MKTIETNAIVTADGVMSLPVPVDIKPGEYRVVVQIEEQAAAKPDVELFDFPVISSGEWPEDLSLHREDMYGDDGR